MRFDYIKATNIGPFRELELDLSAIDGRVIAVCGDNGEGKSTLLELLPGALYRSCPTRGSLTELATARDARLEVRVQNGAPYTVIQHADAISRKSEMQVLSGGTSLLESASVRAGDAWVHSHFPTSDVLYASAFLPQGSQGFLDLSATERKRVLLRMLQIERLEELADKARTRAKEAKAAWQSAQAREADARDAYPDLDAAQRAHDAASKTLSDCTAAVAAARAALKRVQKAQPQRDAARERAAKRAALNDRVEPLKKQVDDLQTRIGNNKKLLENEQAIRATLQQLENLRTRDRELQKQLTTVRTQQASAEASARGAVSVRDAARETCAAAHARLERTRQTQRDLRSVQAAVRALPIHQKLYEAGQTQLDALQTDLQTVRDTMAKQSGTRIDGLRSGLHEIAANPGKTSAKPVRIAETTLSKDDEHAELAETLPKREMQLRRAVSEQNLAVEKLRATYYETREQAAREHEVKAAKAQFDEHMAEADKADAELARLEKLVERGANAAKKARNAVSRVHKEHQECNLELQALAPKAALGTKLDQAQARLDELQPQLTRTLAEYALVCEQLDQLPPLPEPDGDMVDVQQRLDVAVEAESEARVAVTQTQTELERAREGAAVIQLRQTEVATAESELSDYTRLGRDLGKDGLQALEIDAALPELQALTNDLLHSCHGPRFTVSLSTTVLSSDGKRALESLEVRVLDTQKGREAPAESYSGGERVILSEALSLALTALGCRRANLTRPTLVRDESGAALDVSNARAYVAMLRRAADMVDAAQVLFVSHSPELWSAADAQVHVRNGAAEVVAS